MPWVRGLFLEYIYLKVEPKLSFPILSLNYLLSAALAEEFLIWDNPSLIYGNGHQKFCSRVYEFLLNQVGLEIRIKKLWTAAFDYLCS